MMPPLTPLAENVIALAHSFTKWWRIGLVIIAFGVATIWIAATPCFSNGLNRWLESQFPPVNVERLPQSDAVILLGGTGLDFNNPANRIMHALQIYRAGKAPVIVYSGGDGDPLIELGVPRAALIVEMESRTTRENAVHTASIFKAHGWRSGILVTSAAHMPRALAAFQRVGLSVVPGTTRAGRSQYFQMDSDGFRRTTGAFKEILGLLIYRFLGWA
jgi:uncharacterized SAM-binding protein YcdF (DUF218 family)